MEWHSWSKTDYNVTRFCLKLPICYIVVRFSPQQLGTDGRVQNHKKVQFRNILYALNPFGEPGAKDYIVTLKITLYLVSPSFRNGPKTDNFQVIPDYTPVQNHLPMIKFWVNVGQIMLYLIK